MAAIDPAKLVALRQRVAELSSEQRERLREKIEQHLANMDDYK